MKYFRYLIPVIAFLAGIICYDQFQKNDGQQLDHAQSSSPRAKKEAADQVSQLAESSKSINKATPNSSDTLPVQHSVQKTQEELDQLTEKEQKSLWGAFAEARRGVYPIAESKRDREENIGYDFYSVIPSRS